MQPSRRFSGEWSVIHSLEDKTKRELIDICKIQIEEYQQLTKQFNYVVDLYESRIENMEKDRGAK